MSSTASVVPSVSYHLPKSIAFTRIDGASVSQPQNLEFLKKYNTDVACSSQSNDNLMAYNSKDVNHNGCSSRIVNCSIDSALRNSLKSSSFLHRCSSADAHISASALLERSLSFHESSAPSLDVIVKQKIESLPRSLILTSGSEDDLRSPERRVLCSFVELERWFRLGERSVPHQALGLGNCGNTCYLNSVLQCILATGPLLAYINCQHSNPNNCPVNNNRPTSQNVNKVRFCGLCGLSRLIYEHTQRSQNSNGRPPFVCGQIVPSYFVSNVRSVCPGLRPYQQEDAHEFLLGLLSRLEDSAMAGLGKLPQRLSETNVVRRIFGGVMRSEVTCHSCYKVSARDEQWFNLSMDITSARSLQQCLHNYIRSEQLCGQNAYKCENCSNLRPAMRKCTVFRAPPVLIIQFNRFSRCQKLDMHVEFPLSFNLRPFMTICKGSPVIYRLYATVNHEGYSCRSGHYISFSRRHDQWLSHNDSFVSTTTVDHVLRQSPYLLFYELIQPNFTSHDSNNTNVPHKSSSSTTTNATNFSAKGSSPPTSATYLLQQSSQKHLVSSGRSAEAMDSSIFNSSETPASLLQSNTQFNPSLSSATLLSVHSSATQIHTVNQLTNRKSQNLINSRLIANKLNFRNSQLPTTNEKSLLSLNCPSTTCDEIVEIGPQRNHIRSTMQTSIVSNSQTTTTTTSVHPTVESSNVGVNELLHGTNSITDLWAHHPMQKKSTPAMKQVCEERVSLPMNTKRRRSPGELENDKNCLVDYSCNEASDGSSTRDDPVHLPKTKRVHSPNDTTDGIDNNSDSSIVWIPASNHANYKSRSQNDVSSRFARKRRKRHKHKRFRDKHAPYSTHYSHNNDGSANSGTAYYPTNFQDRYSRRHRDSHRENYRRHRHHHHGKHHHKGSDNFKSNFYSDKSDYR